MAISSSLKIPAGFGAFGSVPQSQASAIVTPSERTPNSAEKAALQTVATIAAANIALPETKKNNFSPSEERILKLLTDGHSQETVAATLGITASAISQCISRDDFRNELAARKAIALQKYKNLDDSYDRIEQSLASKLEASVFMMTRPGEIVAALSKVNAMKRRVGASDHGSSNPTSTVVNITLPVQIVHKFTTTQEGHIVAIDDKSLITIPSNALNKLAQDVPRLEHKDASP